jgi:hypothetical protein
MEVPPLIELIVLLLVKVFYKEVLITRILFIKILVARPIYIVTLLYRIKRLRAIIITTSIILLIFGSGGLIYLLKTLSILILVITSRAKGDSKASVIKLKSGQIYALRRGNL